ncbi:DUF1014-domain-containing protein [Meredithblackwellia eburnea MCA 4105]
MAGGKNPKAAGQERKAAKAENAKAAEKAKLDKAEDDKWAQGTKGKGAKDDKAAKAEADRARKAEAARLLAEEEASTPSAKPKAAAGAKKAGGASTAKAKPAVSAASKIPSFADGLSNDTKAEPQSFSASGIDDALDMLTLVTERTDKAAVGSRAAQAVELHPERKYKAALKAYMEEELPQMKKDYPGLRLQQYNERLHKAFEKSPKNPFNQVTLNYNATKDDKVAALQAVRNETAERLRDD